MILRMSRRSAQDAMVGAAEIGRGEDGVRVGDEIAIGEEQELDQVHHGFLLADPDRAGGEGTTYVSHIDIFGRLVTFCRRPG